MPKILGVAASLRNARYGAGGEKLLSELKAIRDDQDLIAYLEKQTKIRADDFISSGQSEGLSFDKVYSNLLKLRHDRGLSNSEASLVAGLWGAHTKGAEIDYVSLAEFFPHTGEVRNIDALRQKVLEADGLLISGPVYFGDRGSLAQSFIEFLREDEACAAHVQGMVYGGISVGAKRNGGQESQLIFQMADMLTLGSLVVGNDHESTAQYGGTTHAGDVGTLFKDEYGIWTSVGTGRRVANVTHMVETARSVKLHDKARIGLWLLQDRGDRRGYRILEKLADGIESEVPGVSCDILDLTHEKIVRCIACDLCPTGPGHVADYRCIIKDPDDAFTKYHDQLVSYDGILPAIYSPVDRRDVHSTYQKFIERTRYLRHDDYALGDRLAAPLVISEIDSQQNMHVRMMFSMLRHHMVMHRPLIGREMNGEIINWNNLVQNGIGFANQTIRLAAARLLKSSQEDENYIYNPVGYEIGAAAKKIEIAEGTVDMIHRTRRAQAGEDRQRRVTSS